jgi:aspartate/methionine/tyrosine aminotransferase
MGTNVVYLTPQWPNIHTPIHLVGGEPRPVPMMYDTDFRLDLDRVFAACDARTRAICFSSPCNPTGWTATTEELQALLDFSRQTGIWLICDEVYSRLFFSARAAPSILGVAEDGDRVLSLNSFSKAWAMTGWRVGWLTHTSGIADQLAAMTQYVNSGTAAFVQAGAHAAMTEGEPLVEEIRQRIKTGLDLTYDRLGGLDSIALPEKPRGGMYAFFQLKGETDSKRAAARLIAEAKVGLSPGYLFGKSSQSFLRMCVFRDSSQIALALDRLVAALN